MLEDLICIGLLFALFWLAAAFLSLCRRYWEKRL